MWLADSSLRKQPGPMRLAGFAHKLDPLTPASANVAIPVWAGDCCLQDDEAEGRARGFAEPHTEVEERTPADLLDEA